jgi:hypothetical protein
MNVISLVLYSRHPRYWLNLPIALIGYLDCYTDFEVWLYVPQQATLNPIFLILEELSRRQPRFKLKVEQTNPADQEAVLWRWKPMWEPKVNTLLCRDIDSVPSTEEIKAVGIFRQTRIPYHFIRSSQGASFFPPGLSGFNPKSENFSSSWMESVVNGDTGWGCDQRYLELHLSPKILSTLDSPIHKATACNVPRLILAPVAYENFPIFHCSHSLLRLCDNLTLNDDGFAGRPQGVPTAYKYLSAFLSAGTETSQMIQEIISRHELLQNYYDITKPNPYHRKQRPVPA